MEMKEEEKKLLTRRRNVGLIFQGRRLHHFISN